ncbi:MAG: tetratricopeptide repeat protein [Candidatus Paceibacterota bacterium]
MNTGKKRKVRELIENKNFNKAIELLEEILEKNPNDTDALYNLGFAYDHKAKNDEDREKFYPKAEEAYKKALKVNPKLEKCLGGLGMLMWYKARHASKNNKKDEYLKESSNYLEKAYKINENHNLLPIIANIKFEKGETEEGEKYLLRAEKILEDPFSVYVNGAFRLVEVGQNEKAKKYAKKALKNANNHWDMESKIVKEYITKLEEISKNGKLKRRS